jgi:hypothetical protein
MRPFAIVTLLLLVAAPATAQTSQSGIDIGAHLAVLRLGEVDATDAGAGINVAVPFAPRLALDGAFSWFPAGDAGNAPRVASQARTLGLVGVTSGFERGRITLFARARTGFLRFTGDDQAVCIAAAVFPPPLECQLAAGYTAFAADLGGGARLALDSTGRFGLRADIGDLIVRYGRPAFRRTGGATDGFISHNLSASVGLSFRP